jgi:hypothetical protein
MTIGILAAVRYKLEHGQWLSADTYILAIRHHQLSHFGEEH